MKDNKIALRYAKALFEVAKEQHLEDNIRSSFLTTLNVLNEHNTLYKIIISPVIDYNSKIGIISKSKIKVNTESLFYNFLLLLIAKNRANLICDIQSNYETLYFDDKKIMPAVATFAFKPDEAIIKDLSSRLKKITGFDFILNLDINDDIIGGFKITYKDKLIDLTIKNMLNELEELVLRVI